MRWFERRLHQYNDWVERMLVLCGQVFLEENVELRKELAVADATIEKLKDEVDELKYKNMLLSEELKDQDPWN